MRKMIVGLGVLLLGYSVQTARAASEPNSPFVNDKTVLFGRLQTDRINAGLVEQFIEDAVSNGAATKPADFAQFQSTLHTQMGEVQRWLREFKEAGGHEIDMIAQSDSMERSGGAVIVPLTPGANAEQIAALLKTGHKDTAAPVIKPQKWEDQTEIIPGKAVLYGQAKVLEEFTSLQPAPVPQIAEAISASGDAAEVLIFAPDASLRAHLIQNLPSMLLMQPTAQIVNGTNWIEQFATMPPGATEHLLIQTKDATTAMQMSQLISSALALMTTANNLGSMENRTELVKLLTPQVQNDRVVINLDTLRLQELVRVVRPEYMGAVQQSLRTQSVVHMKQILVAMTMYCNDHKEQWPADLNSISKYLNSGSGENNLFINPADPDRKPAYIYTKPNVPLANPSQQMVLYEAHDKFGKGINVGFADGHIEFISSPQRFKDLLLQSLQENSPDQ